MDEQKLEPSGAKKIGSTTGSWACIMMVIPWKMYAETQIRNTLLRAEKKDKYKG